MKGESLGELRSQLVAAVGPAAAGQTAATVAAFSGLVRVADGTGIPLDDGLASTSAGIRRDLDLDTFAGAANSSLDTVEAAMFIDVDALWRSSGS